MKLPFFVISLLAVLPIEASDAQPFAPVPLVLESPLTRPASYDASIRTAGVRIVLPVGPVRFDYDSVRTLIQGGASAGFPFLDAPGPESRHQHAAPITK